MTITPHVLRDYGVSAVIAAFGGLHDGGAWALTEAKTRTEINAYGEEMPIAELTFTIGTKYDSVPVDDRQKVTMRIAVVPPNVKGYFDV